MIALSLVATTAVALLLMITPTSTAANTADTNVPCTTLLECPALSVCVFPYASCVGGTCVCGPGYRWDGDSCQPEKYPNDACEEPEECQVALIGSTCTASQCSCPAEAPKTWPTSPESGDTAYCYDILAGATCVPGVDDQTCLTVVINPERGVCADPAGGVDYVCGCQDDYWENNEECVPFTQGDTCAEGSDVCESNLQCVDDGDDSFSCQCAMGTVWRDGVCVDEDIPVDLEVGESCSLDASEATAFCASGICAECTWDEQQGAKCQETRGDLLFDEECALGSSACAGGRSSCMAPSDSCDSGVCTCPESDFRLGGECHPKLYCKVEDICVQSMKNYAGCVDNECVCDTANGEVSYYNSDDGLYYCGIPAGEPCGVDGDDNPVPDRCLTERATEGAGACVEGMCGCTDDYMLESGLCVPVEYMSPCTDTTACPGFSACLPGEDEVDRCMCDPGLSHEWQQDYGYCIHADARKYLLEGAQCNTDNAVAGGLICAPWLWCGNCPEDDDGAPTTCLAIPGVSAPEPTPIPEINRQCTTLLQCPPLSVCVFPYSTCYGGHCECLPGYRWDTTAEQCLQELYQEACTDDSQCQVAYKYSQCIENECACPASLPNTYPAAPTPGDTAYCYGLAAGEVCEPGTNDNTCLSVILNPARGLCADLDDDDTYNCGCQPGYQLAGEECVTYSEGEDCVEDVDICEGDLTCRNAGDGPQCLCPDGQEWRFDACVDEGVPADLPTGAECSLDPREATAFCASEWCDVCPWDDGEPEARCQEPRGDLLFDDACEIGDNTCRGGRAECSVLYDSCDTGACQCPDTDFPLAGECHPKLYCQVVDICAASMEGAAACVDNQCVCDTDNNEESYYHTDGRYYCGIHAGEPCGLDDDNNPLPDWCTTERVIPGSGACVEGDVCGCSGDYVLEGQVCMPVGYESPCTDTTVCPGFSACLPNGEGEDRCLCDANINHEWQPDYGYCIHADAQKYLGVGEECNTDNAEAEGLICAPWLACGNCPDDEEGAPMTCQMVPGAVEPTSDPDDPDGPGDDGASALTMSITLLLSSSLLVLVNHL